MTDQPEVRTGLPEGVSPSDTDVPSRSAGSPAQPEVPQAPVKEVPVETPAPAEEATKDTPPENKVDDSQETPVQEDELVDYPDYGDETANSVAALLREAKIDIKVADGFFREAAETGDMSKIKITELVEAVGRDKANMIMLGFKEYFGRMTSSAAETVAAVHAEVGGADNWTKVRDWARSEADANPEFAQKLAGYNQMFDLNKTAAVLAVRELRAAYDSSSKNSSLVRKQVVGDSAASRADTALEPLSRNDYHAQVKAAHARGDENEITRLRAQRSASHQVKQ